MKYICKISYGLPDWIGSDGRSGFLLPSTDHFYKANLKIDQNFYSKKDIKKKKKDWIDLIWVALNGIEYKMIMRNLVSISVLIEFSWILNVFKKKKKSFYHKIRHFISKQLYIICICQHINDYNFPVVQKNTVKTKTEKPSNASWLKGKIFSLLFRFFLILKLSFKKKVNLNSKLI